MPVPVSSLADDEYEGDETFRLVLSDPSSNARLDRAVGIGTIETVCIDVDDDTQRPPTLTFATGAPTGGLTEWGVATEGERVLVRLLLEAPLCSRPGFSDGRAGVLRFCFYADAAAGDTATGSRRLPSTDRAADSQAGSGIGAGDLNRGTNVDTFEDALDEDDETFTIAAIWHPDTMPSHYQGIDPCS